MEVLSIHNDHLLFTTNQIKSAIVVKEAQITGAQPTVLQDFFCIPFIIVIAGHDAGSFYQNLPYLHITL